MRFIIASVLLCTATLVVAAPWAVQLNAGTAARRVQHHSLTSVCLKFRDRTACAIIGTEYRFRLCIFVIEAFPGLIHRSDTGIESPLTRPPRSTLLSISFKQARKASSAWTLSLPLAKCWESKTLLGRRRAPKSPLRRPDRAWQRCRICGTTMKQACRRRRPSAAGAGTVQFPWERLLTIFLWYIYTI